MYGQPYLIHASVTPEQNLEVPRLARMQGCQQLFLAARVLIRELNTLSLFGPVGALPPRRSQSLHKTVSTKTFYCSSSPVRIENSNYLVPHSLLQGYPGKAPGIV